MQEVVFYTEPQNSEMPFNILWNNDIGVSASAPIYFDAQGYKIFAVKTSDEVIIYIRIYTERENYSFAQSTLLWTGSEYVQATRWLVIDSYSNYWYIQKLEDHYENNIYPKTLQTIYGVSKI